MLRSLLLTRPKLIWTMTIYEMCFIGTQNPISTVDVLKQIQNFEIRGAKV